MAAEHTYITITEFLNLSDLELERIQNLEFTQADRGVITHEKIFKSILKRLAKCTNLEGFDPSYSPYTSGVPGGGIDITIDEFKELCDVLEKIPSLKHLRLNFNGYYDGKKRQYYGDSEAPKTHKYLGDIDLPRFQFFCDMLYRLKGLEELNLLRNNLGKMTAEKISVLEKAIIPCRILKFVANDLSQLDDAAFKALCDMLHTLPNLEKIDLRTTALGKLGNERFIMLTKAITTRNRPIEDVIMNIDLRGGIIEDGENNFSKLNQEGTKALFNMIAKCHPDKDQPFNIRQIINVRQQLAIDQIPALGDMLKDYRCLILSRDELPSTKASWFQQDASREQRFEAFCKVLKQSDALEQVFFGADSYFYQLTKEQCRDLGNALKKCNRLNFSRTELYEDGYYVDPKRGCSGFFEMAAEIENLEHLNLANSRIDKLLYVTGYKGSDDLGHILRNCQTLDLSGNDFGDKEFSKNGKLIHFFRMLAKLENLENLKINLQYFDNNTLDEVWNILKDSKTLVEIDSTAKMPYGARNRCQDVDKIKRFSEISEGNKEYLKRMKKLKIMMDKSHFDFREMFVIKEMDLQDLTKDEMNDVACVIESSKKIEVINLSKARMGEMPGRVLRDLGRAISRSLSVKKIDLEGNDFAKSDYLKELMLAISYCSNLKHVNLKGNGLESLDDEEFEKICKILSKSKTISCIELDESKLSQAKKTSLLRVSIKDNVNLKEYDEKTRRMHHQHQSSESFSSSSRTGLNVNDEDGNEFPAKSFPAGRKR